MQDNKEILTLSFSQRDLLSESLSFQTVVQILYHLNQLTNCLEQSNAEVDTTSIRKWLTDIGSKI